MKLYNEKRSELEEQQLHLNVGLSKIRDTFSQVEELQKSLGAKRAQLREKDELGKGATATVYKCREKVGFH